jgi:hypothetical protein
MAMAQQQQERAAEPKQPSAGPPAAAAVVKKGGLERQRTSVERQLRGFDSGGSAGWFWRAWPKTEKAQPQNPPPVGEPAAVPAATNQ